MELQQFVGTRIRVLRKNRGYTQQQLGEKVRLPQSYIGGIERGEVNVSLETLERIIGALEIRPEEVFKSVKNNTGLEKDKLIDKISVLLRERNITEIELVHNLITDLFKVVDLKK